jgi:tetratricopeptide (TPR) repeat protein
MGLGFYIGKTLVPLKLSPDYAWHYWSNFRVPYLSWAALGASAWLALLSLKSWRPALLLATSFYVATLLPVVGLVKIGHEAVADRYSYIPCLGWALLCGAALRALARPRGLAAAGKAFAPLCLAAAAALSTLSWLTWRQIPVWHDSVGLWRRALRLDPLSSIARGNLAVALLEQNRASEAVLLYQEQARLFPTDEKNRKTMEDLIARTWGKTPEPAKLYNDAGTDLMQRGELDKAVWYFDKALSLDGGLARARNNLGLAFYRQGRTEEAIRQYKECLRLAPDSYEAQTNLGIALARMGRLDPAIARFKRALRLKSDYGAARESLGLALKLKSRSGASLPPPE